jgi:hypothetical protein
VLYTVSHGTDKFSKRWDCYEFEDAETAFCEARDFARAFCVERGIEYNGYRMIGPEIVEMKVGKHTTVFDERFLLEVRMYKWTTARTKNNMIVVKCMDKRNLVLHRLVAEAGEGQLINHADGNGLNNLLSNLINRTKDDTMKPYRHRKHAVPKRLPGDRSFYRY